MSQPPEEPTPDESSQPPGPPPPPEYPAYSSPYGTVGLLIGTAISSIGLSSLCSAMLSSF